MSNVLDRIRPIVESKVSALGFELYDLKLVGTGKYLALRVSIDREGGVTIGDCEAVSGELSVLLDVENVFNHQYHLEVSSPGTDRRLTTEKDYHRSVGRRLRVFLKEPVLGKKELAGELLSCHDGTLLLRVEKDEAAVALSNVMHGKIEVVFK